MFPCPLHSVEWRTEWDSKWETALKKIMRIFVSDKPFLGQSLPNWLGGMVKGRCWSEGAMGLCWALVSSSNDSNNNHSSDNKGFHQWLSVKNLPARQEMRIRSLDGADPLEEGMATHSNFLACRIPWTEETGWLQSVGSQRVRHDWSDWAHTQQWQ